MEQTEGKGSEKRTHTTKLSASAQTVNSTFTSSQPELNLLRGRALIPEEFNSREYHQKKNKNIILFLYANVTGIFEDYHTLV